MPAPAPKYPEVAEFVDLLRTRYGAVNVAELADMLRLDVNERRQLYKYAAGENRPTFTKLMPLLRASGMLTTAPADGPDLATAIQTARRLADEAEALVHLLDRQPRAATSGGEGR